MRTTRRLASEEEVALFDVMLMHALAVNTTAPTDEEVAAGTDPLLLMRITAGIALPLADPTQAGRPLMVPVAHFGFRVDRDACIAVGTQLISDGNRMPKPSGLEIVSDVAHAEQTAARLRTFRNG